MARNTFTTKDCCSTSFGKKKDCKDNQCELNNKKPSKWKFWKKNK